MTTAFWDLESRSTVALDVTGPWRYAADPTTEILCIGYAMDAGEPKICLPNDPPPEELITADEIVAHNFMFERAMATCILTARHGWPAIPLSKQRCSMTMALARALPAALEKLAKALELPFQKDVEGYRLGACRVRADRAKARTPMVSIGSTIPNHTNDCSFTACTTCWPNARPIDACPH